MRAQAAARAYADDGVRAWHCGTCAKYTVTVDVDTGKVPGQVGCRATAGCDGYAHEVDRGDGAGRLPSPLVPRWEWYLPDGEQLDRLRAQGGKLWAHVHNGGMLLRRRHHK